MNRLHSRSLVNDSFAASLLFAPGLAEGVQYATAVAAAAATRRGHDMCFYLLRYFAWLCTFAHITVHITLLTVNTRNELRLHAICLLSDFGSKQHDGAFRTPVIRATAPHLLYNDPLTLGNRIEAGCLGKASLR